MLAALFLLGWIPWALVVGFSIVIVIASEFDRNSWATGALIVGAALIGWVTKTNPLPWLQAHLLFTLFCVLGYFVAGTAWGFVKWYFFNLNIRDQVEEFRRTGISSGWRNVEPVFPPHPSDHKSRVIGWMTYWPWNMVAWLLREPVRRSWNFIYQRVQKGFEKISAHVFRNITVPAKTTE